MLFLHWSGKTAANAVSLAAESRLLFDAGYLSRAYYLAHMSTEESAKSILLHAMDVLRTPESEMPRVSALLRNHRKKIEFLVTYASTQSEALQAAIGILQVDLITHINDLKNDTMYVSYKNGVVIAPEDKVAGIEVDRHIALAATLSHLAKSRHILNQPAMSDMGTR